MLKTLLTLNTISTLGTLSTLIAVMTTLTIDVGTACYFCNYSPTSPILMNITIVYDYDSYCCFLRGSMILMHVIVVMIITVATITLRV